MKSGLTQSTSVIRETQESLRRPWVSSASASWTCDDGVSLARSEKTGTVTSIVIRSGPADLGRWVTERRNVLEDYRRIFGEEPGAIALSIDTNDTHTTAETVVGTIQFTKR